MLLGLVFTGSVALIRFHGYGHKRGPARLGPQVTLYQVLDLLFREASTTRLRWPAAGASTYTRKKRPRGPVRPGQPTTARRTPYSSRLTGLMSLTGCVYYQEAYLVLGFPSFLAK